jgi:CubicO group peptidase (beta-lactamase class C family)
MSRRIRAVGIVGVLTVSVLVSAQPRTTWPTKGWPTVSPASQGFDSKTLDDLDRAAAAGVYGNVDWIVVTRGGSLVFDKRYPRDYREISRGRTGPIGCGEGCSDPTWMHEFNYLHPRWHPFYESRDVHTLQSVTKSIAATVLGTAVHRGRISGLDLPLLTFFRERNLARVDPRLRRATLEDLLTMRSGIEWHESDRPLDETNTTVQLEKSKDWIQFTLDQPMDSDPGTKWSYNSGGSQLMSAVVRSATGQHIDEYARTSLFEPLGIRDLHWKKTPTGHPDTEGGLYLSAPDLAKIGLLYLRDGQWDGARLLPQGWVENATTRHVTGLPGGWAYGYQWWVTSRDGVDIWAGRGFGGQILLIIPSRDTVAVVNAWNVFGTPAKPIFEPLVTALLTSRP